MAVISAVVQDEHGNPVGERIDLPADLFPNVNDIRFVCLRFIDAYGDTYFNGLQAPAVLQDLQLLKTTKPHELVKLINRLEALARVCEKGTHLYLKFIGD
jgi:hypothetical protein